MFLGIKINYYKSHLVISRIQSLLLINNTLCPICPLIYSMADLVGMIMALILVKNDYTYVHSEWKCILLNDVSSCEMAGNTEHAFF